MGWGWWWRCELSFGCGRENRRGRDERRRRRRRASAAAAATNRNSSCQCARNSGSSFAHRQCVRAANGSQQKLTPDERHPRHGLGQLHADLELVRLERGALHSQHLARGAVLVRLGLGRLLDGAEGGGAAGCVVGVEFLKEEEEVERSEQRRRRPKRAVRRPREPNSPSVRCGARRSLCRPSSPRIERGAAALRRAARMGKARVVVAPTAPPATTRCCSIAIVLSRGA